jgi:multiple sugar transport system permease protein
MSAGSAKTFSWKHQRARNDLYAAMLFLMPNLFGLLAFVVFPVLFSLVMAFTNWDLTHREPFGAVGLENFRDILWGERSKEFWRYFLNTVYFMLGMPVSIAGSLLLAILVNRPIRIGKTRIRRWLAGTIVFLGGVCIALALWQTGRQGFSVAVLWVTGAAVFGAAAGVVFFRTMFYLPQFTAGVAIFILWKNLFQPQFGLINQALGLLLSMLAKVAGLVPPAVPKSLGVIVAAMIAWLTLKKLHRTISEAPAEGIGFLVKQLMASAILALGGVGLVWICWRFSGLAEVESAPPVWLLSVKNLWAMDPEEIWPKWQFWGLGARDAIVFMSIWATIGGGNMLLYLAGLTTIPRELYEAVEVDGAGRWAKFRHVTWPQLAPTTFFIVVLSIIAGLQGGFEQARVMTQGGPAETTVTLGYYIYLVGFQEFQLGLASAICWIVFGIIFAMTALNWRYGNRYIQVDETVNM